MNAWLALTKKEFRLGLPAFITALLFYAGIILSGYVIGYRINYEITGTMTALFVVVALHSFFLILYLSYTLQVERKRLHLWLHTPMPVAGLILSKLTTGLVFMVVTFFPLLAVAFTLLKQHNFVWINQESLGNFFLLVTGGIFSVGIFIAIIFVFFWSIFLLWSQYMNDFLSFLLTFIFFLAVSWGYQELMETSFMEMLTNWGAIQVQDIIVGMEYTFGLSEGEVELIQESNIFYIGHWVRDLIVATLAFLAACWVIDKKVEV